MGVEAGGIQRRRSNVDSTVTCPSRSSFQRRYAFSSLTVAVYPRAYSLMAFVEYISLLKRRSDR
jgi:hypothetical protein